VHASDLQERPLDRKDHFWSLAMATAEAGDRAPSSAGDRAATVGAATMGGCMASDWARPVVHFEIGGHFAGWEVRSVETAIPPRLQT
jgi:hypothetical protein